MGAFLFANHATSRLRIATPAGSPTLTLPTGDGDQFPIIADASGDFFLVAIDDRRSAQIEICKCTARNGDILTVLRGQEGTLAQDFIVGAVVSNRLTAGTLAYFQDLVINAGGYDKVEADARFVNVTGDVMSGNLTIPPPTIPEHAATRYYVDGGLAQKANTVHQHVIADTTNLQTSLDGKMPVATAGGPYGAVNNTWVNLSTSFTIDWSNIQNKPTTFPPTLPIPSSGVTGLDQKQTDQDNATAANSNAIVTLNTSKMPVAPSGLHGGNNANWVNLQPLLDAKIGDAPSDGYQYGRQSAAWTKVFGGASVADVAPSPALPGQFWWESDTGILFLNFADLNSTQWIQVNQAGMPEAPNDAYVYMRGQNAWRGSGTMNGSLTMLGDITAGGQVIAANVITGKGYRTKAGLSGGLGGNWMNWHWVNGRVNVWIDDYNPGYMAYTSDLAAYYPTTGGTINGGCYVTGVIQSGSAIVSGSYFTSNNGFLSVANQGWGGYYALSGSGAAQVGGCLGYNAGNTAYGIVGYGGYAFYGAGMGYCSTEVRGESYVRSLGLTMIAAGHPTTTGTANGYMNTNGVMYRSTSSAAFKTNIEPLGDTYASKVLELKPIWYRPGKGTVDRQDWSRFGLAAEDCYAVDPRFAQSERKVKRDEDGRQVLERKMELRPNPEHHRWLFLTPEEREVTPMPEPEIEEYVLTGEVVYEEGDELEHHAIDLQAIVAALLNVVQRQEARIKTLEASLGV